MMIGRKPKPTKLKLLAGNPGKGKLPENEPEYDNTLPSIPEFLNEDARAEWARLGPMLCLNGVLTQADRAVFAAYCQSYGRWAQAERQVLKLQESNDVNGLLATTKDGNIIYHPMIGIANKAHKDMVRYAVEFGLGASARSRISVSSKIKDKVNPFSLIDDI